MKIGIMICLIILIFALPLYANDNGEGEIWDYISEDLDAYPEDIAELLSNPPGTEIIDLGEKGLEPEDEIVPYLEEYVSDDTQVLIPEGTYSMNSSISFSAANASIIGKGEVVLVRPEENEYRIHINSPDDFQLWNITLEGIMGHWEEGGRNAIGALTTNPEANIVLWNVHLNDGAIEGDLTGLFVHRTHAGYLYLVDVEIAGFADNGLYGSAPGLEGQGEVHVYGGVYRNNNITNVRIGSSGSSIRNVISIHDQLAPRGIKHGYARNQRGLWIWSGEDILVENVHMIQTVGWNPIVIRDGTGDGMLRNIRILTESESEAIRVGSGRDWEGSNIHFTGGGDYSITGAEFEDIYYDDDAESPAEKAFEIRPDTDERKIIFLVAEGFNSGEYNKVRNYLTAKGALVEDAGIEESTVISADGEVSTDIKKLTELDMYEYHALFIPGGSSYEILKEDSKLLDWIANFYDAGLLTAAVSEGSRVLKEAGIEIDEGLFFDENLLTSDNIENISQLNLKFVELLGISSRKISWKGEEVEIKMGYVSPGSLNIFWEREDMDALSYMEALIENALTKAQEDYDPEEHRAYSAYMDPEVRQIMDGEWEEAGYETVWDAAERMIYSFALTGPHAPDRDPETLKNLFTSSPVYGELSSDERSRLDQKYYEDKEEKTFLFYSSDPGKEIEDYNSKQVTISHDSADMWKSGLNLVVKPDVEYRAVLKSGDEISESFALSPSVEPENFNISLSNLSWREFKSLSLSFFGDL